VGSIGGLVAQTGVGGSGEAHQEHATSDWRRGSGTMCAPVVNNGATHLESYTRGYQHGGDAGVPLLYKRGASLDPVDDARRIDVNAAFGQKLHHIRITP